MACFELYQLFGTIITWLLISRSGYRRANLFFDAHNVLVGPRVCRRDNETGDVVRCRGLIVGGGGRAGYFHPVAG